MLRQVKKYIWLIFLGLLMACTKNTEIGKEQASTFVKYFGGSAHDMAMDMAQCDDGGYSITGQMSTAVNDSCAFFIRTDQYGNELNFSPVILNGNTSIGNSLCQTQDSGFLVVGSINVTGRPDKDVLLVKVKKDGTIAWTKTYGGSRNEEGFSISELASGNILIGGYTESIGNGGKDAYGLLLDHNGIKIWEKSYGFGSDEVGNYLVEKGNYFLLVGYTDSHLYSNLRRSVFLVKIDKASGNILDVEYYGDANDDSGIKSVTDSEGNIYILGNSVNSGISSIYLLKLKDDFHQVIWKKYLPSANSEVGNDIILNNGQIIIVGSSGSDPNSDFLIDVLDTDGNLLNPDLNTIQALGNQVGMAGVIGSDGKIIVAGSNQVQRFSKIALLKTDLPK